MYFTGHDTCNSSVYQVNKIVTMSENLQIESVNPINISYYLEVNKRFFFSVENPWLCRPPSTLHWGRGGAIEHHTVLKTALLLY